MCPDDKATSVPEPIAIPISACVNAGASFISSPTIITLFPHGSRFASSIGQVINGLANDPL
jgi:hypothetical protein